MRQHHAILLALSCAAIATVIAITRVAVNEAGPKSDLVRLPEHDGLAARYPKDAGLATDPAVILADGFEVPTSAWSRTIGKPVAIDRPEDVHAGRRALALTIEGPASTGLEKYMNPGFDRLFLRYYLKYDSTFPGAHHVGGMMSARAPRMPETAPGIKPDGANKFDISLDHWAAPAMPPPGHLVAYVYHMDQQHQWGEHFAPSGRTSPGVNAARGIFGPSFVAREDFVPSRGQWHCYELMVQANTPDQRDGRIAFWFDGRLAADFPNLKFRTVETLKINRAYIAMYQGGKSGPLRIWVDDVVVATTYIGPMTNER
jgi:hypothetical protein